MSPYRDGCPGCASLRAEIETLRRKSFWERLAEALGRRRKPGKPLMRDLLAISETIPWDGPVQQVAFWEGNAYFLRRGTWWRVEPHPVPMGVAMTLFGARVTETLDSTTAGRT